MNNLIISRISSTTGKTKILAVVCPNLLPCVTKVSHDKEITLEIKADDNSDIIQVTLSPQAIDYFNHVIFVKKSNNES